MRHVRHSVTILLFGACCLAPHLALAETYEQSYIRMCSNGPKIGVLSHQYDRAAALLDENRYSIAKKLAVALYDCSASMSDRMSTT